MRLHNPVCGSVKIVALHPQSSLLGPAHLELPLNVDPGAVLLLCECMWGIVLQKHYPPPRRNSFIAKISLS